MFWKSLKPFELNRTQPLLQMRPGIPALQSHDYEQHDVTSLFAALDVKTGKTISSVHRGHRRQKFLKFLDILDAQVPADLKVHIIMDDYATHKVDKVRRWFLKHPATTRISLRVPILTRD
jgi:hypothetical protein